jgi:hypothetical protein
MPAPASSSASLSIDLDLRPSQSLSQDWGKDDPYSDESFLCGRVCLHQTRKVEEHNPSESHRREVETICERASSSIFNLRKLQPVQFAAKGE